MGLHLCTNNDYSKMIYTDIMHPALASPNPGRSPQVHRGGVGNPTYCYVSAVRRRRKGGKIHRCFS